MLGSLKRAATTQVAATVFCGTACVLTGLHPVLHMWEGGMLDSFFEYLYAASLEGMRNQVIHSKDG